MVALLETVVKLTVDSHWVIIDSDGRRYLGRVVGGSLEAWDPRPETDEGTERLSVDHSTASLWPKPHELVALCPCYELSIEQVPQENGQTGYAVALVPYGLFGHSRPVQVSVGALCRIGDLHETDRDMVVQWVRLVEDQKTGLRLARVKLVAPLRHAR